MTGPSATPNSGPVFVGPRGRFAWWPVGVGLFAVAVLLTATSSWYGYHRDELYFLAAGHHLAWSYPDQGPVVPLLWRIFDALGHGSIMIGRIPAIACAVGATLAAAEVCWELGGRAVAQTLTTVVVGLGSFVLGAGHLLVTATFDLLIWAVLSWLIVHIIRTGRDRLWLAAGAVAGLGLLNKDLPEVLLLGLVVGLAAVPDTRQCLRSRWFWLGGLLAALIWAPALIWQARHGWPQLILAANIHREYSQPDKRIDFVIQQLLLYGPVGLVLWVTGLISLWRRRSRFLVLGWIWAVAVVLFAATAGQGYYPAGTYPALIAAGAVAVEHRIRRPAVVLSIAAVAAVLMMPPFLPILPARTMSTSLWAGLGQNQLETVGWPELTGQVAQAYRELPSSQRSTTTVFTTNYGEAGAIDRFGPELGLPAAYSGHNGFGYWGPPPEQDTTVIAISEDGPPPLPACRQVDRIRNATGVANEEAESAAIYFCAAPTAGWAATWPTLTHLSS